MGGGNLIVHGGATIRLTIGHILRLIWSRWTDAEVHSKEKKDQKDKKDGGWDYRVEVDSKYLGQ